ncbi:MAG: queuosine precursor transporter [Treponema sp.]
MKQNTINQIRESQDLLPCISGLFVGVLLLSNILSSKMISLWGFSFDGGTLLFPLSYIFGDVLTEVYGYKTSRRVIWTGFIMLLIMSINIYIISALPRHADWTMQKDFDNILLQMPRLAIASLIAYFMGEYTNSVVLSKMKVITKGKHLWMRTIGSTLVGEGLDTVVFVLIAFLGVYSTDVLFNIMFSNYVFKTLIEVVFTPITYKVISFVKEKENLDIYDYNISYNPLLGH